MFKRLGSVLVWMIVLCFPASAHADAIFDNDFFIENRDHMEEVNKSVVVNSPMGFTILRMEPGIENDLSLGNDEERHIMNGEVLYIQAVYQKDGGYWGSVAPGHSYNGGGWVPMDELLILYDQAAFESENIDAFYTYTGSYDKVWAAEQLVLWQWPGSDLEKRIINTVSQDEDENDYAVTYAYKDANGLEWGKMVHYDAWLCLSDPENSGLHAFNPAPDPAAWSPDDSGNRSAESVFYPSADPPVWSEKYRGVRQVLMVAAFVALAYIVVWIIRRMRK